VLEAFGVIPRNDDTDTVFILPYAIALTIALVIYGILRKIKPFRYMPYYIDILILTRVIMGSELGILWGLYAKTSWYDTFMHITMGITFAFIGHLIFVKFISTERKSVVAGALLIVSFAIAVGCCWEVFEYGLDIIMGTNCQRTFQMNGLPRIGEDAIFDTMTDIIADIIGAVMYLPIIIFNIKLTKD
jgi:hypothetical protein